MNSFEKKILEHNNLQKAQTESLTGQNELQEIVETLFKAGFTEEEVIEKAKYIRREGSKGKYKYIYEEPKAGSKDQPKYKDKEKIDAAIDEHLPGGEFVRHQDVKEMLKEAKRTAAITGGRSGFYGIKFGDLIPRLEERVKESRVNKEPKGKEKESEDKLKQTGWSQERIDAAKHELNKKHPGANKVSTIEVGQKYHSPAPDGGEAIDFTIASIKDGKYTIETFNKEGRKGDHTFDEKTIKELVGESKPKK